MRSTLLKGFRFIYRKVQQPNFPRLSWPEDGEREIANSILNTLLQFDKPCLIGRIGTVEGAIVMNYISINSKPVGGIKLVHI